MDCFAEPVIGFAGVESCDSARPAFGHPTAIAGIKSASAAATQLHRRELSVHCFMDHLLNRRLDAHESLAAGSIGTRAAGVGHRLRVQAGAVDRKAAEDNPADHGRRGKRIRCGRDRDPRRAIGGETIDAGGNGGKGDRGEAVGLTDFDGAAIARGQRLIFAQATAVPDRTDGMNHMPRRQPISIRDFGIAGLATMERATFG